VTAAELLSVAAFDEGAHAQAFPSFGSERTGAPVAAFCRIDDAPIRSREPIAAPDAVIVQDPTLLGQVDVLAGLRPDGFLLINSRRPASELALPDTGKVVVSIVAASDVALRHVGRPLPNAALLGAFAALTGRVSLPSVLAAIKERFSGTIGEANCAAAREAHEIVQAAREELAHA
jgi:pyruvate ferredoxin oxidoreductase gamma subunit